MEEVDNDNISGAECGEERDIDPLGHSALIGHLHDGVICCYIYQNLFFFLFFFYLNLVILARFKQQKP